MPATKAVHKTSKKKLSVQVIDLSLYDGMPTAK
jgi:hypothetical protein